MASRLFLSGALLLGIALPSALLSSDLKRESRMEIIRGLTAEYATARIPLPRGKKGLLLDADGKVNEESLKREITQNGTAFPANVLVQVTGIEFQDKQIIFEINGGGKRKTKWYEHLEVGMGNST